MLIFRKKYNMLCSKGRSSARAPSSAVRARRVLSGGMTGRIHRQTDRIAGSCHRPRVVGGGPQEARPQTSKTSTIGSARRANRSKGGVGLSHLASGLDSLGRQPRGGQRSRRSRARGASWLHAPTRRRGGGERAHRTKGRSHFQGAVCSREAGPDDGGGSGRTACLELATHSRVLIGLQRFRKKHLLGAPPPSRQWSSNSNACHDKEHDLGLAGASTRPPNPGRRRGRILQVGFPPFTFKLECRAHHLSSPPSTGTARHLPA